jgi:hypothetical protein
VIPKIVHYCWFGGKPKPLPVECYVENWRNALPGYEIKEWNEENFDVAAWTYAEEALDAGKFAFVSDVARLHALYAHGGIYLDTDVEVMRDFDDLLQNDVVLGFEEGNYIATSTILAVPGSRLIKDFLQCYRDRAFVQHDGRIDQATNVQVLTTMLDECGLKRDGNAQVLQRFGESIRILDRVALSPIDYLNGIDYTEHRTYAAHHFGQSWAGPASRFKSSLKKAAIRLLGGQRFKKLRDALTAVRKMLE